MDWKPDDLHLTREDVELINVLVTEALRAEVFTKYGTQIRLDSLRDRIHNALGYSVRLTGEDGRVLDAAGDIPSLLESGLRPGQ